MHALNGEIDRRGEVVAIAAEIAGQHHVQARGRVGENAIGAAKLAPIELGQIDDQTRRVNLKPVGAGDGQALVRLMRFIDTLAPYPAFEMKSIAT